MADLRIAKSVIMDLVLRHLHLDGVTSLEITRCTTKVAIPIPDAIYRELRQQQRLVLLGHKKNILV
jgi:hypothetical protein